LSYYLYILRCADGTFYTGHAHDIARRIKEHNSGKAAKYTSGRLPVELVYSEVYETRSLAAKREHQIKSWDRARKKALIEGRGGACDQPGKIDRPPR
jgi:predicted GIY-YIG superfamily endonuclease